MSDTTLATAAMWVRRIDDPQFSERDLAAFEHWIGLDVQNRDAFEQAQAVWVETQLPDSSIDQILALAPTGKPRSWFLPKGRWLICSCRPHCLHPSRARILGVFKRSARKRE